MSGQQGGGSPYGYNPYAQQQQGGMQPGMMPPWGMGMGMPQMGGGSSYGGYGGGMDPQMVSFLLAGSYLDLLPSLRALELTSPRSTLFLRLL